MLTTRSAVDSRLIGLQSGRPTFARMGKDEVEDFVARLRETAIWCARNAAASSPSESLRPARLAPATLSRDRHGAVDSVRRARQQDMLTDPCLQPAAAERGRLLVYYPDAELTDGAARAESAGFFDVFNAPPWGTWVGYFEERTPDADRSGYLLAWVPDRFIPLAAAGIAVNPEECVVWLEDTSLAIREVIAAVDSEVCSWLTANQ